MLINDIFKTVQGEGIESGLVTTFVRTGRCNLMCRWCDTKFRSPVKEMTIGEIMRVVRRYGAKHVCITGGEPLMEQDYFQLEAALIKEKFSVIVETNGTLPVERCKAVVSMDIKPPSSGEQEQFHEDNIYFMKTTDQVKFVIADKADYRYAVKMAVKLDYGPNIIFMPVWDKKHEIARRLAEWMIKDKSKYRLSLQANKILNLK